MNIATGFISKNNNFIATIGENCFWFSSTGAFIRPALDRELEYAQSWGVSKELRKVEEPREGETTHTLAVQRWNGRIFLSVGSNWGDRIFEVTQEQLSILEKLEACGSFFFGGYFCWYGSPAFGDAITKDELAKVKQIVDWAMEYEDGAQAITQAIDSPDGLVDMG